MIRWFESSGPLQVEGEGRMQWAAALGAGLIAGLVLLLVPRGSPWSSLTFFSPAIMGRAVTPGMGLPLPVVWAMHLAVALVYGVIISGVAAHVRGGRAILAGGVVGFVLYLLNLGVVSLAMPAWRGNEAGVAFTHVVFGLIAGGAYLGLLRRKAARM